MCVAGERCEISVEREPLWRTLAITFATTAVQTSRAAAAQQHHLQTMRSGARDVTGTQLRRFNTLAGGYCGYVPTRRALSRTGGYETKHVTSSFLALESGDAIVDACTALLAKLWDSQTEGAVSVQL